MKANISTQTYDCWTDGQQNNDWRDGQINGKTQRHMGRYTDKKSA